MKLHHIFLPATALAIPIQTFATPQLLVHVRQGVSFSQLAEQCGRDVHPDTLQAVARVESQFNPFAIGVVKGALKRQPETYEQAVAAAKMLHAQGRNFSLGLMQINRYNLPKYGLDYKTVFHPCKNIRAGAAILSGCFNRAGGQTQANLHKAFSCYYSGNFRTGFFADFKGQPPYVRKILNAARLNSPQQMLAYSVPAVAPDAAVAMPARKAVRVSGSLKVDEAATAKPSDTENDALPTQQQPEVQAESRVRAAWDVFGDF